MINSKSYIVEIVDVIPHSNAERLILAQVLGWTCVVGKDAFKKGDKALYIEVDSVLTPELEQRFLGESKVKLDKGRIRAIRLRGEFSQGLLVPLSTCPEISQLGVGDDCDTALGITKYEPPVQCEPEHRGTPKKKNIRKVTVMPRYVDTVKHNKVPHLFAPDEMVHISSKIHGTSVRFGYVEVSGRTRLSNLWFKFRKWIGMPAYEFVVGSRNVDSPSNSLYREVAEKYELRKHLKNGEILFGEIVGFTSGGRPIQGNGYTYGCAPKEAKLYAYALMKDEVYQDYDVFCARTDVMPVERVPLLYLGSYGLAPSLVELYKGRLPIEEKIPCREGVVIAAYKEQFHRNTGVRKICKCINPEYLLNSKNSDEH